MPTLQEKPPAQPIGTMRTFKESGWRWSAIVNSPLGVEAGKTVAPTASILACISGVMVVAHPASEASASATKTILIFPPKRMSAPV
jgi:hypothetical protein